MIYLDTPEAALGTDRPTASHELARTMADLHVETRRRITDLLDAGPADTLIVAHRLVETYLRTERRLVLLDPARAHELGIDLAELLSGRRAIRRAVNRVAWADAGSIALARALDELRSAFLAQAVLYARRPGQGR